MVIGFKKQFVGPLLNGTKVHTIREDAKGRWKPAMIMHMATGTRTKYYNCFMETKCKAVQPICMFFNPDDEIEIIVAGKKLSLRDKRLLAARDGFENLNDFTNWWYPVIQNITGQQFDGKIIHWTDLKY